MIDVYYNLHKKCLSIRHKGKVIGYENSVAIYKPQFIVQQSGRKKVIKEKRKNVHAFVRGYKGADNLAIKLHKCIPVLITYNPYKYKSFMAKALYNRKLYPIYKAQYIIINDKHMVAWIKNGS